MAVVSCTELARERRGEILEDGTRKYTRQFQVITDDATDGPQVVLTAGGLPAWYSAYSSGNDSDTAVFAKKFIPEQDPDSRIHWTVDVEYDSKFDSGEYIRSQYPNPLDRPPDVSWGSAVYTVGVEQDLDGVALKNSANDPFDPPYATEISRPVLTIVVNLPSFDPQIKYDYENHVNSDPWFDGEEQTWLCRRIDSQLRYEGVQNSGIVEYWETTFVFEHNADKWNPVKILDIGYHYLTGGSPDEKVKIHDNTGQPVSHPVRLDGSGGVLPEENDDEFLEFTIYREASFTSLGIL